MNHSVGIVGDDIISINSNTIRRMTQNMNGFGVSRSKNQQYKIMDEYMECRFLGYNRS